MLRHNPVHPALSCGVVGAADSALHLALPPSHRYACPVKGHCEAGMRQKWTVKDYCESSQGSSCVAPKCCPVQLSLILQQCRRGAAAHCAMHTVGEPGRALA